MIPMENVMSTWRDRVRRVEPYVPGEQPKVKGIIKLNTNENPYPPSPEATRALEKADMSELRLYPDPEASVLREAIAREYGTDPGNVFVGVGSDDVIAMCFMTFFNSKEAPVLFPDVSYSFYEVWAELLGIPYRKCALDGDLNIVKEDYLQENAGIIFPNPNAPTGIELPLENVEFIIRENPDSVVIVDEAYVDFGGTSAAGLIEKYDNLLVVQTFSKSRSSAGLRIGYAFGCRELIKYLEDVKFSYNSYTMNRPALIAGAAVISDSGYFRECTEKIIRTREMTKARLKELGFECTDSRANFVFVKHEKYAAADIFEYLKKNKIYVRWFNKERISNYLRITIGTDGEMEKLFEALKAMEKVD